MPEAGEKTREEPVWYLHPEDVMPDSIGGPVQRIALECRHIPLTVSGPWGGGVTC